MCVSKHMRENTSLVKFVKLLPDQTTRKADALATIHDTCL